jgi:hypothetical protein
MAAGGGHIHRDRARLALGPTARAILALLLALVFSFELLSVSRAGDGRGPEGFSAWSCAKRTALAGDPSSTTHERHHADCAICCATGCGGSAPARYDTVEAHAALSGPVERTRFVIRRARRADSFGHSWSSRAPPAHFS